MNKVDVCFHVNVVVEYDRSIKAKPVPAKKPLNPRFETLKIVRDFKLAKFLPIFILTPSSVRFVKKGETKGSEMNLKGFVLIEKNNKYLLIKEAAPKWKGKWYLPGGGIKPDETLEAGAKRETLEEAGCEVELVSVFCVKRSNGFFNKKVTVFFCGKQLGDIIKTRPDKDSLEVRWFGYEELSMLSTRPMLIEIIDIYRNHTRFIPVNDFVLEP